jgi:(1->4)-alpha-D-glucan 1-alpha-D-glucosylmutase
VAGADRDRPELRATYRLQLTADFDFARAQALIPYLRDLGISHLYLSPSLQARDGSTHGYDVVDPTRISAMLGGEDAFRALASAAHDAGMGIVLDTVPNHMAVDDANRFWTDLLLRERFFDIDPATGRPRRFFDIDDLAGVRVEVEDVFAVTQGLVLKLVREGVVDALRIDHPDGLADPGGYLARLRDGGASVVWVEKILEASERLPAEWPVSGTVGYEFLNDVCGLFVDPYGEAELSRLWHEISDDDRPFGVYALEAKLEQARGPFMRELERLQRAASGPLENVSTDALALAVATSPIYRTYEPPAAGEFITRFQQTTPPVVAKGIEDTAFYRYGRLLALNDVGGNPERFGVSVDAFHARAAERAAAYPEALLTTMTHDTKRSTDVRARITALAGMPSEWTVGARRLLGLMETHCTALSDGRVAPDLVERYFILQTLVGAWPLSFGRLDGYLEKAFREAKRNTNWISPDDEYEAAVRHFTRAVIADPGFLSEFEPLHERVVVAGERILFGQLAIKLTAPGVPDTYQGDELELLALVDPDNRRAVDWELRQTQLARLQGGGRPGTGFSERKLWVTARLLGLRARRFEAFAPGTGTYEPLDGGPGVCAYLRGGSVLVVVALPRGDTEAASLVHGLPAGRWREALTGCERDLEPKMALGTLVDADTGVGVYESL